MQQQAESIRKMIDDLTGEIEYVQKCMDQLQDEYTKIPDFSKIHTAMAEKNDREHELERLEGEYLKRQDEESRLAVQKNRQYQEVLKICKILPYERNVQAYEEAWDAAEEYGKTWQSIKQELFYIQADQSSCIDKQDQIERYSDDLDEAFEEKKRYSTRAKECEIQIRQLEEYLNSPELIEKAKRLKQLEMDLDRIKQRLEELNNRIITLKERLRGLQADLPEQ